MGCFELAIVYFLGLEQLEPLLFSFFQHLKQFARLGHVYKLNLLNGLFKRFGPEAHFRRACSSNQVRANFEHRSKRFTFFNLEYFAKVVEQQLLSCSRRRAIARLKAG